MWLRVVRLGWDTSDGYAVHIATLYALNGFVVCINTNWEYSSSHFFEEAVCCGHTLKLHKSSIALGDKIVVAEY